MGDEVSYVEAENTSCKVEAHIPRETLEGGDRLVCLQGMKMSIMLVDTKHAGGASGGFLIAASAKLSLGQLPGALGSSIGLKIAFHECARGSSAKPCLASCRRRWWGKP